MKLFSIIRRHNTPLVVVFCFVLFGSQPAPAQVAVAKTDPGHNNPPPAGAILDLSGSPIPGGGNGTYQHYTMNFTASLSSTAITLAFRDDPAQVSVANVSVVDLANPSVNLLTNGDFSGAVITSNGNAFTPFGWTYANVFGVIAGGGVASGSSACYTSAFCWIDGAVQGFDAISQTIATTIGHTYQVSFDVAEDSLTFATPGSHPNLFPPGYPGSDCYLAAHGGPAPCKFSNISINGDTTDAAGNGIDVTAYAQAGLPAAGTTYTSDAHIADLTAQVSSYATFSNFNNFTCGADGTCPSSQSFTPTSSELMTYGYRVFTGTFPVTGTNLPSNNWILATFPSAVSGIVVFPSIDHFGSAYDGYQYQIYGSNDLTTWTALFDATSVNACVSGCAAAPNAGEPFTLGNFTGTAPSTVNNVLTPQSVGLPPGCSIPNPPPCAVGYVAKFQFPAAYKYYVFGASTEASTAGNADQELSAVGSSQVQTTPITAFDGTTPTTVVFNNTAGQVVRHDLIFPATTDLTFPITNPQLQVTNKLISNGTPDAPPWPQYVAGGPFATSLLFVKAGDNAAGGGTDIGSMYEDQCFNTTDHPRPLEENCPIPINGKHILSKDIFDIAPPLPPIPFGTTVSFIHYYPNTIPNITTWSPSTSSPNPVCTNVFNMSPSIATASLCDIHDIMVAITGGGQCICGRDGRKGSFAGVFNVPMLLSTVRVNGTQVNTPGVQPNSPPPPPFFQSPLTFDFLVTPAQLPAGSTSQSFTSITRSSNTVTVTVPSPPGVPAAWVNGTLLLVNPNDAADFPSICAVISNVMSPTFQYTQLGMDANSGTGGTATSTTSNANCWIAAPVSNLFYTFNPLTPTPPALPDIPDTPTCPATGTCTVTSITQPGASSTASVEFTSTPPSHEPDGQYLLQWTAQDDVGIRERNVQLLTSGTCPPDPFGGSPAFTPPCYSTTLFSAQINVDTTPPTVTGLAFTPNTAVPGQTITANYMCADPIVNGVASGLAACGKNPLPAGDIGATGPFALSETFTVPTGVNGPQAYTVNAKDVAGNSGSATANYFAGYQFFGFFAPVSDPAPGVTVPPPGGFVNPVINVIKGGQTVAVKWQIQDGNGVGVTGLTLGASNGGTASGTVHLSAVNSTVCATDTLDNSILVDTAGNSGLQDLGGGNYQFNWKTVLPGGACVVLSVDPGDGTQHQAFFHTK